MTAKNYKLKKQLQDALNDITKVKKYDDGNVYCKALDNERKKNLCLLNNVNDLEKQSEVPYSYYIDVLKQYRKSKCFTNIIFQGNVVSHRCVGMCNACVCDDCACLNKRLAYDKLKSEFDLAKKTCQTVMSKSSELSRGR